MSAADITNFTFLNRVEEVEFNIQDRRWQSALALALTLPDICGGIAFPDIVKRYRDGRVMLDRQKLPTRDVGGQYIRWFDTYASDFFKLSDSDVRPYICGERCWQLRCEYLHQNKGFLNDEEEQRVRFHLGVNCGTSVCQMKEDMVSSDGQDIRIDIEQFCLRMCRAARNYYEAAHLEKDFSLYHTPVLDFVKATETGFQKEIIAVLSGEERYGNGLQKILRKLPVQVYVSTSPERIRKRLGRQKPLLWIVTEEMLSQPNQPWRADQVTPTIVLLQTPSVVVQIPKQTGKLQILNMPIQPKMLRDAVESYLR